MIKVENKEFELTALADDLTTYLHGIQSFERLPITLDRLGICSGLKLNTGKTEALWLGRNHDDSHLSISRKLTNQLKFWVSISLLYNNQINARALISQSAMGCCAGKPIGKSRVF